MLVLANLPALSYFLARHHMVAGYLIGNVVHSFSWTRFPKTRGRLVSRARMRNWIARIIP